MKIQIAMLFCAVLLGGCASYSGSYRQQLAYGDSGYYDVSAGYDDNPYYGDADYDGGSYYDDGYYDDNYVDDFYAGGFYGGGNYGYCRPYGAFCAGDPLAVFLFPIGGGRSWLMFDGYHDWPGYGYSGYGYGYGWPGWGFPRDDRDHDRDHHHHHHHQDGDPPDPVTQTPPPGSTPPARLFMTPHPRKGVYTPNSMPQPRPAINVGDADQTPGARRGDGPSVAPPMRWRPGTMPPPSTDGGARIGGGSGLATRPEPVAPPPERTRVRDSGPVTFPSSRPEPEPDRQSPSPRDNSDEAEVRNRRHGDGGGR